MPPHRSSGEPRVCRTHALPLVCPLRHGLRHSLADVASCAGALVGRTAQNIVLIGEKLQAVKAQLEHGQWEEWLCREFDWSADTALRMMQVAERFKNRNVRDLQIDVSALYILSAPSTPPAAAEEAVALAQQGQAISPTRAKALVNKHRGVQTLTSYKTAPTPPQHTPAPPPAARPAPVKPDVVAAHPPRQPLILIPDAPPVVNGQRPTFNQTNEMVDWAKWTWNPVTGCLHTCVYCYARDIAERFYPEKFEPTFRPGRKLADGTIQIGAGHHRVQAALEAGMIEADVFVGEDMDDGSMVRVYARENATQRGVEQHGTDGECCCGYEVCGEMYPDRHQTCC
jgi:hypothetical protein